MKRVWLIGLTLMVLGTSLDLSAALAPLYQSKREIEAILSSQELGHYLPNGDMIQQIVKTPSGYLIITNRRILPVTLRYIAGHKIGPARFVIEFHKPIETNSSEIKEGEEGYSEKP